MIMNEMRTQVLELYTAYFNRAADRNGVDYWLNEMDVNGWSIDMVAQSFADQTEYKNMYAGMTNAQVVSQVYNNVLNRDADSAGATYWESELNGGVIQVSQLVQAVVNAAKADVGNLGDDDILVNKNAVSQYCYDSNINETDISLSSITSDIGSIEGAELLTLINITKYESDYNDWIDSDGGYLINRQNIGDTGDILQDSIEIPTFSMWGHYYGEAGGYVSFDSYDYYLFTAEESGFVKIEAEPPLLDNSDIDLYIYDKNGTLIDSSEQEVYDYSGDPGLYNEAIFYKEYYSEIETVEFEYTKDDVYYIGIKSKDTNEASEYRIFIDVDFM